MVVRIESKKQMSAMVRTKDISRLFTRLSSNAKSISNHSKRPNSQISSTITLSPANIHFVDVCNKHYFSDLSNNETESSSQFSSSSQNDMTDEVLRFDYTGLPVSDRVRQLLDLTNGSKREVVKAQKKQGMELFQLREGDTGSSAVQVIAITTRIQQMQTHLATHRKDYSGKRTLQRLYVRRRKLLDYMERKEFDSYRHVVKTLNLVR